VQRWTKAACAAQFVANPEMATTELAGELLAEFARGRRRQTFTRVFLRAYTVPLLPIKSDSRDGSDTSRAADGERRGFELEEPC